MANGDSAVVGVDLKTQLNDALIALHTSSSLNISPSLQDIIVKADASGTPTDWARRVQGVAEWSTDHEGPLAGQGGTEAKVAGPNMSMKLKLDTTPDDGTDNAALVEIPLLDSVDFSLTQEIAETGGLDKPLWRYIRPDTRDYEISLSGTYVEPTSSNGAPYDVTLDKVLSRSTDKVPFELNVLGVTLSGNVEIGDTTLEAETGGEDAQIDMTLAANSDLTKNGSFESSIEAAFTAFMNKNSVDVGMLHYGESGPESGTVKLSGSGYYSELEISMSRGEPITVSGTVEGDGKLNKATV
ncbi:hypothetical protein GGQ10_002128 [Salinibacter ruber]|uniref:hypothetical protein n=1 Tax=Salinibacter ruber TaxID=146919 RepID=UPI00216985C6|nr:hypothetical protein [Salinibacter ruber]MCS4087302.1 hypothetical protein [Salinibacter ruber]